MPVVMAGIGQTNGILRSTGRAMLWEDHRPFFSRLETLGKELYPVIGAKRQAERSQLQAYS